MATKKTFILSDQSVNSYGFIVSTNGIQLDRFTENPVMLFNHNMNVILGRWENIRVEDGKLLADAVFDDKDESIKHLINKVEEDMLKGVSIGFDLLDIQYGVAGFEDFPVVIKCSLREASLTPLPSNSNALRLYDKDGVLLSDDQVLTLLTSNQTPIQMKKLSFFIAALQLSGVNLAADATEDDVLKEFQKLCREHGELKEKSQTAETEVTKLNAKLTELKDASELATKARREALVDAAIASGKLTADKREQYLKLANADEDTTKSLLDSMPVRSSLSSQLTSGKTGASTSAKYADWDFRKLHREAPEELARLKRDEPERYKELYNAAYSKS